jgi:hypothetical protein
VAGAVAGVVLVALVVVSLALLRAGDVGWGAVLAFAALALAAELLGEEVYGSTTVSLSAVPVVAAAAAGEPVAAVVAALVAGVTTTARARSRRPEQYAFNAAALVCSAGVAVLPFALLPDGPLPLLVAAGLVGGLAYFAVDSGLVAGVVALDTGRRPADVFRTELSWSLPHFAAYGVLAAVLGYAWLETGLWGVVVFLVPPLLARVGQQQYLRQTRDSVRRLQALNEDLAAAKARADEAAAELADRHRATAAALAGAIDARDTTTGGHVERVAALGQALLEDVVPALAADPAMSFGFLLHDVGKIGVPDAVLQKPGPLDPAERAVMDRHPEIGHRIVSEAGFPPVVAELVLTHHERWDGLGYPRGLAGEQIPVQARLFAVADALDAMTSDRPYRAGMPLVDALEELDRHAGTQFDPAAVDALRRLDPARVRALLRLDERARHRVISLV